MNYYGSGVSKGIAIGNVFCYTPFKSHIHKQFLSSAEVPAVLQEFDRLKTVAYKELSDIIQQMSKEHPDKAKIFSAHQEILEDEELLEEIEDKIRTEKMNLDWAIENVFTSFIALLSKTKDPLISARTADLTDVKNRLLRLSAKVPEKNLSSLPKDVIVIAHDLLPSDTATIDQQHILGIITEIGGETSHSAIIAKSYGIPAILGVPHITEYLKEDEYIIANALSGEITTSPTEEQLTQASQLRDDFLYKKEQQKKYLSKPCLTKDHVQIQIGMNVGALRPDEEACLPYTDFIGLYRTEFLYMDSQQLPTEEEQFMAYREILTKAEGKPVTLRTLDIGGDKTLPYFTLPKEENPFLGNRALRLCLNHKELFQAQLRAALRASVYGNLWIMFPMVGSLHDIQMARSEIEYAKASLRKKQIPFRDDVKLGIMIEIPAIAIYAQEAAKYVDFASIGTNDLCQYLSAADRQNPAVTSYYTSAIPAVLRLTQHVARVFHKNKKPVSVCGEMGGSPIYAPLFVGMDIHKLSMSTSAIAAVKQQIAQFSIEELTYIAQNALSLSSTEEITTYVNAFLDNESHKRRQYYV
ncbi:phosphoenolpyruvate--protein phosphotransferase [Faecalicatena acetigenes]|uniref:Phosphoenolpyruvate-protein phosphotransferase n=1 Tax=Faecalicatena acetigenes TaxID=2981790 RepID=A0ABT2T764_9FIRM|nr:MULTISPECIES: phosphoenolpyruvate--protein phosphotransferase [Lachnospiraceae]MCU6746103.1 phosphoenolpyruvate--protein phosphotransferase [Faecalicatena acetigenes]SCG95335.1 Phosphoenolpyruvate-protein phosphotransferase [uncultured Clostridium sp.]